MPAEITQTPALDGTDELLHRAFCATCMWSGPAMPSEDLASKAMLLHNFALHPECGTPPVLASKRDVEAIRIAHTRALRWHPPSAEREPMNIHPEVRTMLRFLCNGELAGTGVGYSEFIAAAILAHQRGDWQISPPVADGPKADA